MSLSSALETLANYRTHSTRASQDVFEKGVQIANNGSASGLGDEEWAFREQLALAAIDVGRLDVADDCIRHLSAKFPESPRVEVLTGIRLEATEAPEIALGYYANIREKDPGNGAAWKRIVAVLDRMGKTERAVDELCKFLDTYYTDVEGWIQLADIYSRCNQYNMALQALSHAMLLSPQNPFYVLQFAETAYTSNDVPLATKMFLNVIDMSDVSPKDDSTNRACLRAWWGISLCCHKFIHSPSVPSASQTTPPLQLQKLHELATEQLLKTYSSSKGAKGREGVVRWLQGP